MSRDYTNYDYLSVSVKSDQLDRILQCYRALGWREEKMEDDREYYNMKYVRLRRPHKIENKDRLQYLQVRMESFINSVSRVNSHRHIKSHAFIAISFIIFSGLVALGLWLAFAFNEPVFRICGWWISGLSVALMACAVAFFMFMRKRENATAAKTNERSLENIRALIDECLLIAPSTEEEALPAEENSSDEGEEPAREQYIEEEQLKEAANG